MPSDWTTANAAIARSEIKAAKLRKQLGEPSRKLPKAACLALWGDAASGRTKMRYRHLDNLIRARVGLDPVADRVRAEPSRPDVRVGRTNPRVGQLIQRT